MTDVEHSALLSLATASIAFTVAETKVFERPRRLAKRIHPWAGKLVSCGYCISHWVAFALVAIYQPRLFIGAGALDWFLTAVVIAWLAAFQWVVLAWIMAKVGK